MNKNIFLGTTTILTLIIIGVLTQSIWRQTQAKKLYNNIAAVLYDNNLTKAEKITKLDGYSDQVNAIRLHRPILNINFSISKAWFDNDFFENDNLFITLQSNQEQTTQEFTLNSEPDTEKVICAKILTRTGELTICPKEGCYLDENYDQVCACVRDEYNDCVEDENIE